MSTENENPQLRERIVQVAASLLADEGTTAFTTRRIAREAETSTMAVYTHFGGMRGLRGAVRTEAFRRLLAHLESVGPSQDPVHDLAGLGIAYCNNALANPELYRAVFLEAPIDALGFEEGLAALEPLIGCVRRCIEASRFKDTDPGWVALQLWITTHGAVAMHLTGALPFAALVDAVCELGRNLFVGLGDDPIAADDSVKRARPAFRAPQDRAVNSPERKAQER